MTQVGVMAVSQHQQHRETNEHTLPSSGGGKVGIPFSPDTWRILGQSWEFVSSSYTE